MRLWDDPAAEVLELAVAERMDRGEEIPVASAA